MKVLIAGYTYIRESYMDTFEAYPEKDGLFFLVPKKWKARGGKVEFTAPEKDNVFKTRVLFHHSHYPFLGGLLKGWMPFLPFVLLKLKKQKRIGIVFSVSEPMLLTALYNGFWSKIFGLKHIVFTWQNVPLDFSGFKGLIKKIILKLNFAFADGLVCGNKKASEIFKPLTQKPMAVIPTMGLNPAFFKPSLKTKAFDGKNLGDKLVFTFVGAVNFRKGVHVIIEAFKKVSESVPGSHLFIAGSSGENLDYEKNLDGAVKEYGLESNVKRLSWLNHEQLAGLLNISDVFVHPSLPYKGWEEQFGYSMAEASLMELPVISTKSGSIEDIVVDGETGILVEPGNVGELAAAMKKLADNENLRQSMGRKGREHIMKNFDNKIVAGKYHEFFKKIH